MLELPHTAVGAMIGAKIANPLLSLPLSLASHFVLDIIPHWNPSLCTETKKHGKPTKTSTVIVVFDTLASLVLGFFVASREPNINQSINVIACCFMAVLPDVIEGPYFFLKIRPNWLERWIEFQHNFQTRAPKIPGLLTQLALLTLTLFLIFA